jgi:excisionase family DNA binding protein
MTALLQSIPEAAASIGVGRSLMYELVATGQVETVHVGRRRLVVVASVESYVEKLRTASSSEVSASETARPALRGAAQATASPGGVRTDR